MRTRIILTGVLLAAALCACQREALPPLPDSDEEITVSFSLRTEPLEYDLSTKAISSTDDTEDSVDRIDVFEYNGEGELVAHKTWEDEDGIDLATFEYQCRSTFKTKRAWVFVTNLTEDTANYIAKLTPAQFGSNQGAIPLGIGNFRLHKPIMCGGANFSNKWNDPTTQSVTLYRYQTRFNIGTITADFNDVSLMNQDVKVKSIFISQVPNMLQLITDNAKSALATQGFVTGSGGSINEKQQLNAFGGATSVNHSINNYINNWGGGNYTMVTAAATGTCSGSFPYIYNNNYQKDEGIVVHDAPGDLGTATYHAFGANEAVLCKSGDLSVSHTATINKALISIPVKYSSYSPNTGGYSTQDYTQKLVIEVEIDGTSYFYCIWLMYYNCNHVYNIENITLKGLGTRYSNVFYAKVASNIQSMSITESSSTDFDNIDL